MSVIKKYSIIIIVVITIACIVFIAGCGVSAFGSTSSNTSKTNQGSIAEGGAKIYETKKFSILWADMWDVIDVPDGTMIYNLNYSVLVTVTGNDVADSEAKAFLEDIAKQKNGTPVEVISLLGGTFYKTSFTADEKDQTMYSGVLSGQQVKITVTGKDTQNNETVKAIIESIKLN